MSATKSIYQQGRDRIAAYQEYRTCCISDYRMRRIISKGKPAVFARIQFRVGSIVRTKYTGKSSLWLVVGHGFTGLSGLERGCYGCKITDRVLKRWQWIGPESQIEKA